MKFYLYTMDFEQRRGNMQPAHFHGEVEQKMDALELANNLLKDHETVIIQRYEADADVLEKKSFQEVKQL